MADVDETPTTESTVSTEQKGAERPLSLLASEMFGADFHGEVPKVEPESPETLPETPPETAQEPATSEEPEESPISSVSELINHLEADPEWFDGLKVPVKVDGKASEATLKDLVNSYQMQQAAEHRLEEAKSKAKAIVQEATAKNEQAVSQFAVVAKLIENAEALLGQETKSVDWAKLREDDPAEYSAKKADVAERRERIEKMKRDAVIAYQQATQQGRDEMEQRLYQHLQAEHSALLEKLPEWRDVEKAKAGKAKMAEYLMSQGFSQQDVMGASDHRLILMARKAMLYDELQANTNAAKKKVAKVPKVLKPGAPKPQEQVNRERVNEVRAKLRKTGSLDDAFAVLKARRGGN